MPKGTSKQKYYLILEEFFNECVERARTYGQKQHGQNKPFEEQTIVNASKHYGPAPMFFQIEKKAKEAMILFEEGDPDWIDWMYDICVYAAAALIGQREKEEL